MDLAHDPSGVGRQLDRVLDLARTGGVVRVIPPEDLLVEPEYLAPVPQEVDAELLAVEFSGDPHPAMHAAQPRLEIAAVAPLALRVRGNLPEPARLADRALAKVFVDLDDRWNLLAGRGNRSVLAPDTVPPWLNGDPIDGEPKTLGVEQVRVDAAELLAQARLIGGLRQRLHDLRPQPSNLHPRTMLVRRRLWSPDHGSLKAFGHVVDVDLNPDPFGIALPSRHEAGHATEPRRRDVEPHPEEAEVLDGVSTRVSSSHRIRRLLQRHAAAVIADDDQRLVDGRPLRCQGHRHLKGLAPRVLSTLDREELVEAVVDQFRQALPRAKLNLGDELEDSRRWRNGDGLHPFVGHRHGGDASRLRRRPRLRMAACSLLSWHASRPFAHGSTPSPSSCLEPRPAAPAPRSRAGASLGS